MQWRQNMRLAAKSDFGPPKGGRYVRAECDLGTAKKAANPVVDFSSLRHNARGARYCF